MPEPQSIAVRLCVHSAVVLPAGIEAVLERNDDPARRYWHTDLYDHRDGRWHVVFEI